MNAIVKCQGCRSSEPLPFEFTMAFHPIVDVERMSVWGYEALVRGTQGQSAFAILDQVDESNRYKFDQNCRVKAITLAGQLFRPDEDTRLSINFMPNAVYEPSACIRTSLETARRVGFNPRRIMFEFTENERMVDTGHVGRIIAEYKRLGFVTAIDDFGAGHAGLNLLASFQPDIIKIDMEIIRGIADSAARQAIVAGIMHMAQTLDITVIAEGIETEAELATLRGAGIRLFQGYLFALPAIEHLPAVSLGATPLQ
ncbi:EAL domain-containing protein (putative c-di-GMP-specific phosphodiesterase class I) [Microvirga subterranea]|uniref:EAL domain-containing protein (Putative c-di-GMP-specific phosphodiesterase class I) n=2 Tax=Microvirga subterranea TaxID=186651 RepID=A0A370HKB4_9HYPH|nr:EAL domain-containing protein (putative c-di-GMP-specific phosphodiesterase class I) [Microvirga subterranea]